MKAVVDSGGEVDLCCRRRGEVRFDGEGRGVRARSAADEGGGTRIDWMRSTVLDLLEMRPMAVWSWR